MKWIVLVLTLFLVLWLPVKVRIVHIPNANQVLGVLRIYPDQWVPQCGRTEKKWLSTCERYSTHDGEARSVPGVRSNCSETDHRIHKISFVALPPLLPGGFYSFILVIVNNQDFD